MPAGTVKWFSVAKGYGFITPQDGGNDIFVHRTAILGDGHRALTMGDRVEYEITEGQKGPQAVSVRIVPNAISEEVQSKIFVLAGVKELALREVQSALAPMVLQQLEALEKAVPDGDWWAAGVIPYLTKQDWRNIRSGARPDNVPSAQGKEWFAKKLEDVGFLLRYLKTEGRREDDDTPRQESGLSVWSILRFGERFRNRRGEPLNFPGEIETLHQFRNDMSHVKPDKWRSDTDDAITAAERLFEKLQLPDHLRAVASLRRVKPIVRGVIERLKPDLLTHPGAILAVQPYASIADLRDAKESGELQILEGATQRVTVKGTFAPRLLLDRFRLSQRKDASPKRRSGAWRTDLQRWLFRGFEHWAPSWDARDAVSAPAGDKPELVVGQLVDDGRDEGESVCVVLRGSHARTAKGMLQKGMPDQLACFTAELTGRLAYQIEVAELEQLRGSVFSGKDFCIVVDDRDGGFTPKGAPESYTGYLWKCIAPEKWIDGKRYLHFQDVIFVWEHIELTNSECVKWALESIDTKCACFARSADYGAFKLLDKSDAIVHGERDLPWRLYDLRDEPAPPSSPSTAGARWIVPGQGIGKLRLGATIDGAVAAMGRDADHQRGAKQGTIYQWILSGPGGAPETPYVAIIVDSGTGRVDTVEICGAPEFTTRDGHRVSDSVAAFIEEFGQPASSRQSTTEQLWEFRNGAYVATKPDSDVVAKVGVTNRSQQGTVPRSGESRDA